MSRASILAAMTTALLLSVSAGARAADPPTCDQRLASLQLKGFAIPKKATSDQFAALLSQAREDRARGDERSCQADLDEAEALLPK